MALLTLQQLSGRAEQYVEAGDFDAARAEWLGALALAPASAEIMLELSYVESLAGRYRRAQDWTLRAAAQTRPRSIPVLLSLVQRLRTFNQVALLRSLIGELLENQQVPHGVLIECARQLSNLNDVALALVCARAAVERAPHDLPARLIRGHLLGSHGYIDDAIADMQWVLQRNPRIPIAWWMLSRLKKQSVQSNHVASLQDLLRTPGFDPANIAVLARALHKELDDLADYDGAWHALERLCKAKRSIETYDWMDHAGLVNALIAWRPPTMHRSRPAESDNVPIFIVGVHRSGTTLMEQLLDASPQVRGLGEVTDFSSAMRYASDHYCKAVLDRVIVERASQIDFADVAQRYLGSVGCRLGAERFFTDKLPPNFMNIGFICSALPHAKIVHMVRDPVETCFSNLRELFSEINPHSYDQLDMADYFLQYRRLMTHWHAMFPGRILDVEYARLTASPEATMREVTAFCGITYIDDMSRTTSSTRAIATASSIQVREGVLRRETPKWLPYADRLQPLINALRNGGVAIASSP
jgi:tetratricopeptide (TPR) repeat protein